MINAHYQYSIDLLFTEVLWKYQFKKKLLFYKILQRINVCLKKQIDRTN